MDIITLNTTYDDNSSNTTLFDDEVAAYKEACFKIQDSIRRNWNMKDKECASKAYQINLLVKAKNYSDAVRLWNNADENGQYNDHIDYCVIPKQTYSESDINDPMIFNDSHFVALGLNSGANSATSISYTNPVKEPYKATVAGAKCRGDHGEYNPHAYADKSDGTYMSYQCKMFSGNSLNQEK